MQPKSKFYLLRIVILFVLLFFITGFSVFSFFPDNQFFKIFHPFFLFFYSPICHQSIERCININGVSFLVCARCSGIYTGALFISLYSIIYWKKSVPSIKLIYISIVPLLIDVLFITFDFYPYIKTVSFITGFIFGSIIFLIILHIIENHFFIKEKK